ncbi:MAG: sigma-70 family RNA polymerase sigma factor [Thiohalocapsa sp.]
MIRNSLLHGSVTEPAILRDMSTEPGEHAQPLADSLQSELLALVGRIGAEDSDALGRFYDLTINRVYGLAMRILGRVEDAEDAAAEVYLQVWRKASTYSASRGPVMAWLQIMCRSRALDLLRRRGPSGGDSTLDIDQIADLRCASPPELVATLEVNRSLNDALQGLSSQQRQLIALAFFQDLSHSEIADRVGLPLGTVKSHIRRAQQILRSALSNQELSP